MLETLYLLVVFSALLPAEVQAPAGVTADLVCSDIAMPCSEQLAPTDGDGRASGSGPSTAAGSENWGPMMIGTPAGVALTDQPYVFQPVAFDPDGDPLEFRIINAPAWASFEPLTGRLSGTPTLEHAGLTENIVIAVSDGIYVLELPPFSIEVRAPALGSAILSWVAPTQNTDGSAFTDLAGFVVRYGSSPDLIDREVWIPSPDVAGCELHELAAGDWHFEVSAYNQAGIQSDPSERVYKTIS
jgi:hypothetical protein